MSQHVALLPAGLHDLLPPDAAHEAAVVERLMADFALHGYERVKPPLIEFEENLLSGLGAAVAQQTFRLMDPLSQRMMGVRADTTLQVARVAVTRLANAPRPLRLAYTGEVLRVRGSQLRPEREFHQVGCELIGALTPEADAESVLLAGTALERLGVGGLSIDLCLPTLVGTICTGLARPAAEIAALQVAIDRRDEAAVRAIGGPAAEAIAALMALAGPADTAIGTLQAVPLPEAAEPDRHRMIACVQQIRAAAPGLGLTVDPVERRGFEYQTGLSFTVFARGVRGELGRGGRYRAGVAREDLAEGEPATGFTLFMDSVLRALPAPVLPPRGFLPAGTAPERAAALRAEGWVTVAALGNGTAPPDPYAEARRLRCPHALIAGTVRPVPPEPEAQDG